MSSNLTLHGSCNSRSMKGAKWKQLSQIAGTFDLQKQEIINGRKTVIPIVFRGKPSFLPSSGIYIYSSSISIKFFWTAFMSVIFGSKHKKSFALMKEVQEPRQIIHCIQRSISSFEVFPAANRQGEVSPRKIYQVKIAAMSATLMARELFLRWLTKVLPVGVRIRDFKTRIIRLSESDALTRSMGKFKPPAKHYSFSRPTSSETFTENGSYSTDSLETSVPSNVSSTIQWKEIDFHMLSRNFPAVLFSTPTDKVLSVKYLCHLFEIEKKSLTNQHFLLNTFETVLREKFWEMKRERAPVIHLSDVNQ